MGLFRFVRSHPVGLFVLLGLGFCLWIWRDALPEKEKDPRLVSRPPGRTPERLRQSHVERIDREFPQEPAEVAPKPSPQATAAAIPKLKPGMTRVEVESLLGSPAPKDVGPAVVAEGRVTYKMSYDADFGAAPTVRPIHKAHPTELDAPATPRKVVTLEFDATQPGHPLVTIIQPDTCF